MKPYLLLLGLSLLISSCLSTQDISHVFDIQAQKEVKSVEQRDYLHILFPDFNYSATESNRKNGVVVPLLLAGYWSAATECKVHPDLRRQFFMEGVFMASDSLRLKDYLQDRRLVIELEELPGEFKMKDSGGYILDPIGGFDGGGDKKIVPEPIGMTASVWIENKQGNIWITDVNIPNEEKKIYKVFMTMPSFAAAYFSSLRKEMERMSFILVDDVIQSLDGKLIR
jgi:hypothetical protein